MLKLKGKFVLIFLKYAPIGRLTRITKKIKNKKIIIKNKKNGHCFTIIVTTYSYFS